MDDSQQTNQEILQLDQAIENSLKPEVIQCQFCNVKFDTKDDLLLHLVNQCSSIEKKDGTEDVEIKETGTVMVDVPTDITRTSNSSSMMFNFGNMPCGAGYRRDCRKPVCFARHIDDPPQKYVGVNVRRDNEPLKSNQRKRMVTRSSKMRRNSPLPKKSKVVTLPKKSRIIKKNTESTVDFQQICGAEKTPIPKQKQREDNPNLGDGDKCTNKEDEKEDEIEEEAIQNADTAWDSTPECIMVSTPQTLGTPALPTLPSTGPAVEKSFEKPDDGAVTLTKVVSDAQSTGCTNQKRTYEEKTFTQVNIKGDGYCQVKSVLMGLRQQDIDTPTAAEVLQKIKPTFLADIERFSQAILSETDPVQEIEEYVATGNYMAPMADFILTMLSEILNTTIIVLYQNKARKIYELLSDEHIHKPANNNTSGKIVFIVNTKGDHYNSLILRKSKRNAAYSENEEPKETRQLNNEKILTKKGSSCDQPEEIEVQQDLKLYCTCKKLYDYEKHECMIICDDCQEWFHNDCIKTFSCDECSGKVADKTVQLKNTIKQMKEQSKRDQQEIAEFRKQELDVAKYKQRIKLAEKDNAKSNTEVIKLRAKSKKENEEFKEKLQKVEQELKEMTVRCQNTEISHTYMINPEETEESPEENVLEDDATNDQEKLRKELAKMKRLNKKAEKEIENLKMQANQLKNEKFQQVRTIRHLNDSLDTLKRTCYDLDKVNQSSQKKDVDTNRLRGANSKTSNGTAQEEEIETNGNGEKEQYILLSETFGSEYDEIEDNRSTSIPAECSSPITKQDESDLSQSKQAEKQEREIFISECDEIEESNSIPAECSSPINKHDESKLFRSKLAEKQKRGKDKNITGNMQKKSLRDTWLNNSSIGNRRKPAIEKEERSDGKKSGHLGGGRRTCLYYLENGCRNGDRCRDLHHDKKKVGERNYRHQTLKHDVPCRFYNRGYCRYGNHCEFLHSRKEGRPSDQIQQYNQNNYSNHGSRENWTGNERDNPQPGHATIQQYNQNDYSYHGFRDNWTDNKRDNPQPGHAKEKENMYNIMKEYTQQMKKANDRIHFLENAVKKMMRP